MCSTSDEGVSFPEKKTHDVVGRSCMKCTEPAVVIIRVNDAFCRNCFVQYCTHKFRSAFGKSKLVRDGEQVLVAYSGGLCSAAMVHLIQEGLSKRAQKKLRFQPTLVYIDEGGTTGQSADERLQHTDEVTATMQMTGLPFHTCLLEQSLDDYVKRTAQADPAESSGENDRVTEGAHDNSLRDGMATLTLTPGNIPQATRHRLETLFSSCQTLTAKENLLLTLRHLLLVELARSKGFTKVLLGDSATRLSIRILSNITQGRGAHLAYETSFADGRHGDVMFVRPMREFTAKEIMMYNSINTVESVFIPTLSTKAPTQASLERLTEDFVVGLQADFPATVTTIFRTGEKLSQEGVLEENRCILCQAPLDTCVGESSALSATLFSQTLSLKKVDAAITNPVQSSAGDGDSASCCEDTAASACCGEGDGSCQSKQYRLDRAALVDVLCYGCRLVVKDMDDISALPGPVLARAELTMRRKEMKASIQDFLLPEDA